MQIKNSVDLGKLIRNKRKAMGITQADAAGLCNVGVRFLSDLENGKPTLHLQKVIQVVQAFGLELDIKDR